PVEDRQTNPGFGSRQNPVGNSGLVLDAGSEGRQLVVAKIEEVEIESVSLGYGRVLDADRQPGIEVSVGCLGVGGCGGGYRSPQNQKRLRNEATHSVVSSCRETRKNLIRGLSGRTTLADVQLSSALCSLAPVHNVQHQ